jgi:hypothetical protein
MTPGRKAFVAVIASEDVVGGVGSGEVGRGGVWVGAGANHALETAATASTSTPPAPAAPGDDRPLVCTARGRASQKVEVHADREVGGGGVWVQARARPAARAVAPTATAPLTLTLTPAPGGDGPLGLIGASLGRVFSSPANGNLILILAVQAVQGEDLGDAGGIGRGVSTLTLTLTPTLTLTFPPPLTFPLTAIAPSLSTARRSGI